MKENTRVWIYQSNRSFTSTETEEIQSKVNAFVQDWASHKLALSSSGEVLHNRFIVLKVDESNVGASGCSIDTSVRFIQELGAAYHVDFFDRMNFAYVDNNEVKTAQREEFTALYQAGVINDDTLVFNNLVKNVEEMNNGWQIKLSDSWHRNFV